jgi:hypothetical protein
MKYEWRTAEGVIHHSCRPAIHASCFILFSIPSEKGAFIDVYSRNETGPGFYGDGGDAGQHF